MVDALKKLDKKFLIIAGSIIILPIMLIIILAIIQGCSNRKITYEKYETKMISAFEKYLKDENKVPMNEAETVTIKLEKLVESGYIKSTKKMLDDDTCNGSVTVRRNGSSVEQNNGGFLNYTVDLNCKDYSTIHLIDKLEENIATSESGLYLVGEDYIFKGDSPKNYINFFETMYRIVSIDKDGILKLIRVEPELTRRVWDNKFNVEVNHNYGKNIYKDSEILKVLLNDYTNSKRVNKSSREHIVAYDVCVGKRGISDYSISRDIDCSEKLEKQVISLINVSDFALASLDQDCNSIESKSCNNYNYLSEIASSTWTLNVVSDNTYQAFLISAGLAEIQNTSMYNEYNIVIYIDGNELYTEGTGSNIDPYILK